MTHVKDLKAHFKSQVVFTLRDAKIYLKGRKLGKNYLNLLIHGLIKKGELHKITQGTYSFQTDPTLYGFAFSPFYYGLQNALALHNMGTQETNPVIVTPRKVRLGLRTIENTHFIIHRIQRPMFFGYDFVRYYDWEIPVSDLEKTFIDMVYFKQPLTEEVLNELKPKLDGKKIQEYLKRYPKNMQKQVNQKLGTGLGIAKHFTKGFERDRKARDF